MFGDAAEAVSVAVREEIHVTPDAERSKRLQARYHDVYCDLYGQLRTAHHRLHAAAMKP
jgi:hypothetical protein